MIKGCWEVGITVKEFKTNLVFLGLYLYKMDCLLQFDIGNILFVVSNIRIVFSFVLSCKIIFSQRSQTLFFVSFFPQLDLLGEEKLSLPHSKLMPGEKV